MIKFLFTTTLLTGFSFAHATINFNSLAINVECNEITASKLHLSCKSDQGIVDNNLINFDVKDATGRIIATGIGSDINIDPSKIAAGSTYTIEVFALVNGNVEMQTISRHMSK